jgi:Xaa-Pro aminopeptidase
VTTKTAAIQIARAEFQGRAQKLLQHIHEENLSGVVLFDNFHILYYSGFSFIPTERPIVWLMSAKGEQGMFVPRLEVEHAKANVQDGPVNHYLEFPDDPHPMHLFRKMLSEMGFDGRIGADHDGYPWIFGYQGPTLSALMECEIMNVNPFVEAAMALKSGAELALIRESIKWGNLAHMLLQRYTRPGVTETEVSQRASNEATLAMMDTIGPIYRAQGNGRNGPSAGYRGQIGRNAAIPHALANNIVFREGDVLVTGAGCPMWGYQSELERTMIIGKASDEQKKFFGWMMGAQQTAFDNMRPGAKCSDVDRAVRKYFEEHDLMRYWKHHSGHAIGLRYHEGPFLDKGDDTELKPGMVFTVEPGLYAPEQGGFRHSDTVAITEDGIEMMTYYPRDLESLTIPA